MTTTRPLQLAYVPTIACYSRTTEPLDFDLDRLIAALQVYVDVHVAPVWGTPATLVATAGPVKGAWGLVFMDDADAEHPDISARHDVTAEGLPLAKVFVRTSRKHRQPASLNASHELVEMLIDPGNNLMVRKPHSGTMYCYEVADPVEDKGFEIDGLRMSNFVYPTYFETFHRRGSVKFDHRGHVKRPFQILRGGYQITHADGQWVNEYGSLAKAIRHAKEDRRGRRGAHRTRSSHPAKEADMAKAKATKKTATKKAAPAKKVAPAKKAAPAKKTAAKKAAPAKAAASAKSAASAMQAAPVMGAAGGAASRSAAVRPNAKATHTEPVMGSAGGVGKRSGGGGATSGRTDPVLGSGGGRGSRSGGNPSQAIHDRDDDEADEPVMGAAASRGGASDPDGGDEVAGSSQGRGSLGRGGKQKEPPSNSGTRGA